jgi:hypothetical protein
MGLRPNRIAFAINSFRLEALKSSLNPAVSGLVFAKEDELYMSPSNS